MMVSISGTSTTVEKVNEYTSLKKAVIAALRIAFSLAKIEKNRSLEHQFLHPVKMRSCTSEEQQTVVPVKTGLLAC